VNFFILSANKTCMLLLVVLTFERN